MSTPAHTPPARTAAKAVRHPTSSVSALHHDGWTPARQAAFLRALAATHNVAAAARAAGMSRQSAYKLRARLKSQPFDMAWDAAFQCAFDALAQAAMERALNGVEVPHYHKGELVGTSRRYDERLTIALLGSRESFLSVLRPQWHEASGYAREDFRALVARVERGAANWQQDKPDDPRGWDDDDAAEPGESAPAGEVSPSHDA